MSEILYRRSTDLELRRFFKIMALRQVCQKSSLVITKTVPERKIDLHKFRIVGSRIVFPT